MGLVMLITLTVKQRVCGTSQNLIKTSIVGVAVCYCAHMTSSDLNKARDDGVLGWQWHQLDHTHKHTAWCSGWRRSSHDQS